MDTYCADKFYKFDKIDNNNLKIDDYRLLTTYPFIDFIDFRYNYLIFINFINCYRLSVLSIELVRLQQLPTSWALKVVIVGSFKFIHSMHAMMISV